ncbi:hypothetical protein VDG1235_1257 [Verrucomicrobiia bacterium DG1235]|nr:hypothetical protein VDG1235_1257 [Verrucomicrobiae bacterium DG1235]
MQYDLASLGSELGVYLRRKVRVITQASLISLKWVSSKKRFSNSSS